MRSRHLSSLFLFLSLFCISCSITKRLPKDEYLYIGYKNVSFDFQDQDFTQSQKQNVLTLAENTLYYPANTLLIPGKRKFLPLPTVIKQQLYPNENIKGPRKWIGKFFGQDLKLLSKVHPDKRVKKLEQLLVNAGFYGSKVSYEIEYKGKKEKKALLHYNVLITKPYIFRDIKTINRGFEIDTVLEEIVKYSDLKKGEKFSSDEIQKQKGLFAEALRTKGYFYVNPQHVLFSADTMIEDRKVDLFIEIDSSSTKVLNKMYIKDIRVYQYDKSEAKDSSQVIRYIDTDKATHYFNTLYYRPGFINRNLLLEKRTLYSYNNQQETVYRLNNLGSFGAVLIDFERFSNDSLNANIYIDPKSHDVFKLELDVTTKSNNFSGPSVTASWEKQNLFGEGETWKISLGGNYEWQTSGSNRETLGNNSYGFNIKSEYSLQHGVLFFNRMDIKKRFPRTHIDLGYEFINRAFYYSMTSINGAFAYSWNAPSRKFSYRLDPIYVNQVNVINTSAEFDEILEDNPSLARSFEQQFILGPRYSITYTNRAIGRKKNQVYFNNKFASSGNLLYAVGTAFDDVELDERNLFGQRYTQFLKYAGDFRYLYNLRKNVIATRLYGGVGYPLGNVDVMPYVEQFFVGGASSIRAYQARGLGPGSFNASGFNESSAFFDQKGDIRLEANIEFRHSLSKMFNLAYFIDAGNIWLVNEDEDRPGSGFGEDFLTEIAVAVGTGFRFDFEFLVLRLDGGLSLTQPYLDKGKRSVFTNADFQPVYSVHFAIGYPF